jgi:general secretion pathway protein C
MEALFKRYFWIVKTLGVAAAAGLAASAVSTQLGSWYVLDTGEDAADEGGADTEGEDEDEDLDLDNPFRPRPVGATPRTNTRGKDRAAEQLRKFNLFCPTCVPAAEEGAPGMPGAVDAEGRPLGPVLSPGEVKSGLPLRLQATMEADDPEYSLATVYDTENFSVGIYAEGDVIRPGVVVVGVDKGLVHLRNNAALEYIELGGEVPPPKAPDAKKEDEKKDDVAKPSENAIPGAEEAINCPSENLCIVERAFVESLMANPAALAKQARIVPAKDGEVGFKFYGIRRGSLPKLLGLKNGDKLVAVNGEELAGIDQAMSLYTKLRRASNLSISIERKGKTISKEIQIQ